MDHITFNAVCGFWSVAVNTVDELQYICIYAYIPDYKVSRNFDKCWPILARIAARSNIKKLFVMPFSDTHLQVWLVDRY